MVVGELEQLLMAQKRWQINRAFNILCSYFSDIVHCDKANEQVLNQ